MIGWGKDDITLRCVELWLFHTDVFVTERRWTLRSFPDWQAPYALYATEHRRRRWAAPPLFLRSHGPAKPRPCTPANSSPLTKLCVHPAPPVRRWPACVHSAPPVWSCPPPTMKPFQNTFNRLCRFVQQTFLFVLLSFFEIFHISVYIQWRHWIWGQIHTGLGADAAFWRARSSAAAARPLLSPDTGQTEGLPCHAIKAVGGALWNVTWRGEHHYWGIKFFFFVCLTVLKTTAGWKIINTVVYILFVFFIAGVYCFMNVSFLCWAAQGRGYGYLRGALLLLFGELSFQPITLWVVRLPE